MKLQLRRGEAWQDLRLENAGYCFGGGGSGDSQNTTTATTMNFSPEEAARRTQVMDEAQRMYWATAGQTGSSQYPGSAPVAVSAETYAGQDLTRMGAQQVLGGVNQTLAANAQAGQGVAKQQAVGDAQNNVMAQGLGYGLNGAMNVQNNPYLAQAMQAAIRPITESYTDPGGVMSGIRTNASQMGQVGSSRQGVAEGIAAGRYAQAVGDTTAKMGTAAYDQGQKTFSSALSNVPTWMNASQGNAQLGIDYQKAMGSGLQNLTSAAQAPGAMYSGIGAQNENIAKEWADYAANQRMWGINAPWIPLQNYAGIVYGGSAPSTSSSSSMTGDSNRNALGQVVGAGLTAASLYGMMS